MDGLADIQHQDGASWQVRLARLRRSPRLYLFIEGGTLLVLASTCLMTYLVVSGQKQPDKLLTPPVVALLLVANLVPAIALLRSEEHTSELQSLMRISYAVFCLKKKN